MKLIDELASEHELIDAAVGSLRTWVEQRLQGQGDADDGPRFVKFLRVFAAGFHHAREEDTLFVALCERAGLPRQGPIASLCEDHARTAALLDSIERLIAAPRPDHPGGVPADGDALRRLAVEYSHALWHHIDAENSVLFPEGESRLRKSGAGELPSRAMTAEEAEAKALGEDLVRRYPPMQDTTIPRGEGCVCCPAFSDACRGLEQEWWNEWEWEEFEDHLPSG
jgi:hemerythrin-like domain-containing protein